MNQQRTSAHQEFTMSCHFHKDSLPEMVESLDAYHVILLSQGQFPGNGRVTWILTMLNGRVAAGDLYEGGSKGTWDE